MTRADLLCYLMVNPSTTAERLQRRFSDRWHDPMRSLVDLGIVSYYRAGQNSEDTFHVKNDLRCGWSRLAA